MRFAAIILAMLALSVPSNAQQVTDQVAPEAGGGDAALQVSDLLRPAYDAKQAGKPFAARHWMIAAANPLAVRAGAEVLQQGGTAADAMIATQVVLGLVEPQSSGLGGGAFLVWHDGKTGRVTTLDGRETAPLDVTPTLFQDANGAPMGFFQAVVGGRSVGTPGTPALMQAAHDRWGRLNWAGLFDNAIRLADDGFRVSPRLASLVARDTGRLSRFAPTRAYFYPGGKALQVGQVLRNPAYADTLRLIAQKGTRAFYTGALAQDIARTVQTAPGNPGTLSTSDLALYRVKERPAVCAPYRGYDVCGMGPPSSGGLTVGQILGLLAPYNLDRLGPRDPQAWRLIGDASRLAFADRGLYMADSDFVPMPTRGLLDPAYLRDRATLLNGQGALGDVAPGKPEFDHALNVAPGAAVEFPSTSHISIVDRYGNALSMTTTIENGFGSRLMVDGFLLNNELTDFSFATHKDGRPIANRVEPGKRPRSSMSPTIVRKDGKPVLVLGSPGGSRIIGYVTEAVIAYLDWGMDVQQAVSLPHLVNRFGPYDIEAGTGAEGLAAPLRKLGYEVEARQMNSGLHAIAVTPDGLRGGADPRREGLAFGQ